MSIRVLIADDEPMARAGLARLAAEDDECTVVAQCADGESALEGIHALAPDIVLLDVEMPGMSGLEVARNLGGGRLPVVVFVTAFDHYAIQAFDARAIGYLVKPFDDDHFRSVMSHAKAVHSGWRAGERSVRLEEMLRDVEGILRPESRSPTSLPAEPIGAPLTRILVRDAGQITLMDVAEIDWIEAADYYARVHRGGKAVLIRETMAALERRLDPRVFVRIHRSAIVNLARVRTLVPTFRGDHTVVLNDGTKLTLSRARRKGFESLLGQRL